MPFEPKLAEQRHLRVLRHIWRVSIHIVQRGLDPLLAVWKTRADIDDDDEDDGWRPSHPKPARPSGRSPLSPPGIIRRIWHLSNTDLAGLWPQIPPEDVRDFAPWAVSYSEVQRITGSRGDLEDLQRRVRQAIDIARAESPRGRPVFEFVESSRSRTQFQLRYSPEAIAVFGPDGPLPPPPAPHGVSLLEIERTFDWIRLALEGVVREDNIVPAVAGSYKLVEIGTYGALSRVLPIDLDRDIPELTEERARWYREHVDLIETGVRAPFEDTPLRPSLLADVERVIREAHERGLRVEEIAGGLRDRYGVAEKRAELIARDQVLKANGRLHRARQERVGISEYVWSTSKDQRVRKTHVQLHGTTQSWNNPPPVGGGRHEHPGGDYQCRCVAKPVVPKWMQ